VKLEGVCETSLIGFETFGPNNTGWRADIYVYASGTEDRKGHLSIDDGWIERGAIDFRTFKMSEVLGMP
jgi:hypothetical protein